MNSTSIRFYTQQNYNKYIHTCIPSRFFLETLEIVYERIVGKCSEITTVIAFDDL